jgi:hypothetical protein
MADTYKLVSLVDLKRHLLLEPDDVEHDEDITAMRDAVEELLGIETGQIFGAAEEDVEDKLDGTGTQAIWTTRPILALNELGIIDGFSDDEDVITPLDVTADCVFAGRRVRTRYYKFPCGVANVRVLYDAKAYQPAVAKAAVKEMVEIIYRRRGSAESRSEQLGTYTHVFLRDVSKESTMWRLAIDSLHTGQRLG